MIIKYLKEALMKDRKKIWLMIAIIGAACIFVPLVINYLIRSSNLVYQKYGWNISANELGNKEWFAFWGSFIGGIITLIAFIGAWYQNKKALEQQDLVTKAQFYKENLEEEKRVLVNVVKSVDTYLIYKFSYSMVSTTIHEKKSLLIHAQDALLQAQTELEIITDVASSFQQCEKCKNNPCNYKSAAVELRDYYYMVLSKFTNLINVFNDYISTGERNDGIHNK